MTEIVVVAVAAPEVAVIVALPGPTPVTIPAASTVATWALSEVQLDGHACAWIAVEDSCHGVELYVATGHERRLDGRDLDRLHARRLLP